MNSHASDRWRRMTATSAWLGPALMLAPFPLYFVGGPHREAGRVALMLGATAMAVCLVGGLRLTRSHQFRTHAWLCVVGAAGTLLSMAYLWALADEPTAIPIAGVVGLVLAWVMLLVAAPALLRRDAPAPWPPSS